MSKIFCLVGKSSSGKDTFYKEILRENFPDLIPVIPYTTRPMRSNEVDGVNYHFVSNEQMDIYEKKEMIVEKRAYQTMQGIWNYFTLKFDVKENKNYIMITTLAGAKALSDYYGSNVRLIYLHTDDKTRLLRCIDRESRQKTPNYSEVCRRFIADQIDFSEDNLAEFGYYYQIDTSRKITDCIDEWKKIYYERDITEG